MKKLILSFLIITQICLGVTSDFVWRVPPSGTLPSWGIVSVAGGGTGATTFTTGRVLFGAGTSAINTSANLFFDSGSAFLGIGKTPSVALDVIGVGRVSSSMFIGTTGASMALDYISTSGREGLTVALSGGGGIFYPNGAGIAGLDARSQSPYSNGKALGIQTSGATTTYPIVVSAIPATNSLFIIRGGGSGAPSGASCGTKIGEGYTCARSATGVMDVTFSPRFSDVPACVCSVNTGTGVCDADTPTTTTFSAHLFTNASSPAAQDVVWSFVCIGQRFD